MITPSGVIMFVSDAYGGKCSNGYITQSSGFLDNSRAGDEVITLTPQLKWWSHYRGAAISLKFFVMLEKFRGALC